MSTATAVTPLGGRLGRLVRTRTGAPAWERPALAALLLATAGPVRVGARPGGLGQQLLRRGGPGRHPELEGVLLRLPRRVELHHRRQAARVAVGDGAVRRGCSASTRGACWCRRRSRASLTVWLTYAIVRRWFDAPAAPAGRRRPGADAGGGAHVPLQQPRRDPDAAARGGARTPWCGPSRRARRRGSWRPARSSAPRSWRRACRRTSWSPRSPSCGCWRRRAPWAAAPWSCWPAPARWSSPAAGGSRPSS